MRRLTVFFAVLLVLLVAGCGSSESPKKSGKQETRIERIDREMGQFKKQVLNDVRSFKRTILTIVVVCFFLNLVVSAFFASMYKKQALTNKKPKKKSAAAATKRKSVKKTATINEEKDEK